jgi:hypothetical protein
MAGVRRQFRGSYKDSSILIPMGIATDCGRNAGFRNAGVSPAFFYEVEKP